MFKGRATDDSKKQERKQFKSRIFEKLRKPLDETDPDHNNQADVRYMPRLSGDAGNPAFLVSDKVDKMTSQSSR